MKEKVHIVIDVEATGPTPINYSMIQLGHVDSLGNEFYRELRPINGNLISDQALKAIGLTKEEIMDYPTAGKSIVEYHEFLLDTYDNKIKIPWSDNPAFDWQFINGYLHVFSGENPMGFSMRRVGDYYAGLMNDLYSTSKWKKLRDTKHTHNALDDAKGNMEALLKIKDMT